MLLRSQRPALRAPERVRLSLHNRQFGVAAVRLAGSRRQLAVLAVAASDAGAKRRPSTTDAKALTTAIKECSSTVHLQRLISQKGGAFNHIHTTAVISKLAKLVSAVPDGAPPPTAARPPLDAACQEALDAWQHICLAKMDALDGRAISNTLHALARLPQRADPQLLAALLRASLTLLPTFEPQHFSNTIWALAALGHRPSATWLAAFYTASLPALPSFNSQALANTAYGLAKLDLPPELRPPEEWTDAFYAQVKAELSSMRGQEVSNLLYALARLGQQPQEPLLNSIAKHVARKLPAMREQELANAFWALGQLGYAPPPQYLSPLLAQLQASFPRFRGPHWVQTLGGVLALGLEPPAAWMEAAMAALQAGMPALDAASLAEVLLLLVRLDQSPKAAWMGSYLAAMQDKMAAGQARGLELSVALYALERLGTTLPPQWLAAWTGAAQGAWGTFSARQLALVLQTVVRLQQRQEFLPRKAWMGGLMGALQERLGELSPQGVTMVLWALCELTRSGSAGAGGGTPGSGGAAAAPSSASAAQQQQQLQLPAGFAGDLEEVIAKQLPHMSSHTQGHALVLFARTGHSPQHALLSACMGTVKDNVQQLDGYQLLQLTMALKESNLAAAIGSLAADGSADGSSSGSGAVPSWMESYLGELQQKSSVAREILDRAAAAASADLAAARPRDSAVAAAAAVGTAGVVGAAAAGAPAADSEGGEGDGAVNLGGAYVRELMSQAASDLALLSGAQLADITHIFAQVGHTPDAAWMKSFYAVSGDHLHALRADQLSNLIQAVHRLQVLHPNRRWTQLFLDSSRPKLHRFSDEGMSTALVALAEMQFRPDRRWTRAFLDASQSRLRSWPGDKLATMLWSLAELALMPGDVWLTAFAEAAAGALPRMGRGSVSLLLAALEQYASKPHPRPINALLRDAEEQEIRLSTAAPH